MTRRRILAGLAALAAAGLAGCAADPPRRIRAIPEAPCVRPARGRCDATPYPPAPGWWEEAFPYHL